VPRKQTLGLMQCDDARHLLLARDRAAEMTCPHCDAQVTEQVAVVELDPYLHRGEVLPVETAYAAVAIVTEDD
jgi:hypothetical protein